MHSQNGLLLALPSEITLSVLHDWVDLKDLAAVDNAHCERKQRPHFLAIFSSPLFIMSSMDETEHTPECHTGFVQWLCKRSIRVSSLVLLGEVKPFATHYLREVGPHVKSIRLKGTDFVTSSSSSTHFAEALSYCSSVTSLALDGTRVNHAILEAISKCSSLKVLQKRFGDNSVASIPTLLYDGVSDGASHLFTKLNLTTLDLLGDHSGFQELLEMAEPSSLLHLRVNWTNNDWASIIATKLQLCTNLVSLNIWGGNKLTDSQVATLLSACPSVQHFTLGGLQLTAACAQSITLSLPRLKSVELSYVKYWNELLLLLAEMRSDTLEEVDLQILNSELGQGLEKALTHCPNLRTLRVADIDRYAFDYSVFRNITTLVVSCRGSGVVFMQRLAPHCKKLQFLGLTCPDLRLQDLTVLSTNFPALRQFDFLNVNMNNDNPGDILREESTELRTLHKVLPSVLVRWNNRLFSSVEGSMCIRSLFCK